jgi:RNA polymerase sigma factor (sigma-70 family)
LSTLVSPTTPLPPPDTFVADAEIEAYVAKAASRNLAALPALSAFQRAMDRYPQLSPEAQLELVERVRAGSRAGMEIPEARSDRKRSQLQQTVKEGKRAAEYLVGSNFRLVLLICSEKARERYGLERAADVMPDLVGEANVALAEAINAYDPARCPVFATYVARVVRDRVQFHLSKDSMIRLAPSWNRVKRIAAIRQPQLTIELGRTPTLEELRADIFEQCRVWAFNRLTADQQQLPADEREELMLAKLRKQGMLGALANLSEVLVAAQSVTSLDAPMRSDASDSSAVGEFVADNAATDTLFDTAEMEALRATLAAALAELDDRERQIVLLRYGFTSDGTAGTPATYAQIGAQFGVTAERIRQIERGVLDRLASASPQRDRLAAFLPSLEGADLDSRDNQAGRRG